MNCEQCGQSVEAVEKLTAYKGKSLCRSCLCPPLSRTQEDFEAALSGNSNLARSQVYATPKVSGASTALRKKAAKKR